MTRGNHRLVRRTITKWSLTGDSPIRPTSDATHTVRGWWKSDLAIHWPRHGKHVYSALVLFGHSPAERARRDQRAMLVLKAALR